MLPHTPAHLASRHDVADSLLLQARLAASKRNPWLASLCLNRLPELRLRLAALRDGLARLPRRARRVWGRRWAAGLPLAALMLALASSPAYAATITVGSGGCTLDDAITAANSDTATGSCPAGSGPDTIDFASANTTYSYTLALPDIASAITIQGNGNTTIERSGGGAFRVLHVTAPNGSLALVDATISGGSLSSDGGGIYIDAGATAILVKSTISGNTAGDSNGGGISNSGELTIEDSTVTDNYAGADGGGVENFGSMATLTLRRSLVVANSAGGNGGGIAAKMNGPAFVADSTISGNSCGGDGGGVMVETSATLMKTLSIASNNTAGGSGGGVAARARGMAVVADSTISGNSAGDEGGGAAADDATVTLRRTTVSDNTAGTNGGGVATRARGPVLVVNSTVSGNTAPNAGGGVFGKTQAPIDLSQCTIAGNSAGTSGGGVQVTDASAQVNNSIVAHQLAGGDCGSSAGGSVGSGGYNIESGTSCGFTNTGDQQNVSVPSLNLGPLGGFGGPTLTRPLVPPSAAIDRIPPGTNGCGTTITIDQRGISRPLDGDLNAVPACDVGAYERLPPQSPTAVVIAGLSAEPDPTGRVRVAWETASEVDVIGFRVWRAVADPGGDELWTTVGGLVAARGAASGGARYVVVDNPGVGRHRYRLEVIDAQAPPVTHGPVVAAVRALKAFLPFGRR